jgi:predicted HTH transcriptional regulator
MSGNARDFNNVETQSDIKFLFSCMTRRRRKFKQKKKKKLGEHAPSYATVKTWVTQFKRGDFSNCNVHRPGRPKTVTTSQIIDQIHELILEERWTSAKSIVEQLNISLERVGSIIHEDLEMRKLREMGSEMPERGSKTSTMPVV